MSFNKILKTIKEKTIINLITKNMKLKELVEGSESLGVLMQEKLPIVLGYKLAVFIKKASPEIEEYNKKRNELLAEYADVVLDKDKKPTSQMKFKDEKAVKAFNEKINALLDQEIKIDIPKIKIDELAGMVVEPKVLIPLDWLIKS